MRIVKAQNAILCPVRANLLGGWTDQMLWDESAAVVNFALGWQDSRCRQGYPLRLDRLGRLYSAVSGQGTGLGISSIRAAMMYLQAFPDSGESYIRFVLEYEKAILGTEGGWQDQIGGVVGGFKLITTPGNDDLRHQQFKIERRDNHPVLDRIVLFDTGVRRNAGAIGDQVRRLMTSDKALRAHLREVAAQAKKCFWGSADEMIAACNHSWAIFMHFVPGMALPKPLPQSELISGHMLLGAGGGGYGLAFANGAESRGEVIALLQKAEFWATEPLLLNGLIRKRVM